MKDERAKIIDRVRRMQDSTHGRTEAEAESFLAKAAELIAEHAIEPEELDEFGRREEVGKVTKYYFVGNASQGLWALYSQVAKVLDCVAPGNVSMRYVGEWPDERRRKQLRIVLIGRKSNRDMVEALVDTLLFPQMMRDVVRLKPKSRMSFTVAWALRVGERLDTAKGDAFRDAGMSLLPIDPDVQRMLFEETYGRTSGAIPMDPNDVASGVAAGSTADIGNAKMTTTKTALGQGRQALNP